MDFSRKSVSVNFTEVPRGLDREISAELSNYAVGVFRYSGASGDTFLCLGTGTLVTRGGKHGILLARHCLHRCSPPVVLGRDTDQKLVFVLRSSRPVVVGTDEIVEHELTTPLSDPWGPDLTFIEIPIGDRLSRFKAVGSFWSLDRNTDAILADFAKVGTIIACVGHPAVDQHTTIAKGHLIQSSGIVRTFLGVLKRGARRSRGVWDYVQITADFLSAPALPKTFGGVSGGGIWAVTLKGSPEQIRIQGICFVGVAFYQTPMKNSQRRIRGHYVRSVYETAWRDFERPRSRHSAGL